MVAGPAPRSIIVLPFGAPADDDAMLALADSLTSDVTRALADNVRDARVVAPSIAAAYRGKSVDARQVGREANVRYLIEGDMRTGGDEIVVTARLIDAGSGKQVGSERHSFIRSRLKEEQRQLSARVTYGALGMFDNAEQRRVAAEPTSSATAADLVQRAELLMDREDVGRAREARKLYDEAVRRDPSLAKAWIGRAFTFNAEYRWSFTSDRESLLAAMDRDSMRAVALDDHDAIAWYLRSTALAYQSRFQAAFEANDRARELNPTSFFEQRGHLFIGSGRAADALDVIEARRSLLGTDTDFRSLACDAHLHLGHYEQAIAECERAAVNVDSYWVYLNLTAAYAQAGDLAKAAKAKAELMRRVPDLTIARFEQKQFSTNPIWVEEIRTHVISGLRKAGVPE
jgi:TolB-like protein